MNHYGYMSRLVEPVLYLLWSHSMILQSEVLKLKLINCKSCGWLLCVEGNGALVGFGLTT